MANDDLKASAQKLSEGVTTLNRSVQELSNRTRRSEKLIRRVAVSLALSVLLIAALGFVGWKVYTIADCQARQNEAVRVAITERQSAAQLDREGQRQLLDTILNPAASREQRVGAVEAYRGYLAKAETVRSENPLPSAASCQ